MKKLALILTAVLALLLTSCANIQIEYSLDNDLTCRCTFNMDVDIKDATTERTRIYSYLQAVQSYWESKGMKVTYKDDDADKITLSGSLQYHASSKQEAYQKLNDWLTDENMSPFAKVNFNYSESFFEDEYKIDGTISLKNVIKEASTDEIPSDIESWKENMANKTNVKFSIKLPGKTLSGKTEYQLKYDGDTPISLHTVQQNTKNINSHNAALLRTILFSVGGLLCVLLIIIILVKKRKPRVTENEDILDSTINEDLFQ